jgi:hypothetical protein
MHFILNLIQSYVLLRGLDIFTGFEAEHFKAQQFTNRLFFTTKRDKVAVGGQYSTIRTFTNAAVYVDI